VGNNAETDDDCRPATFHRGAFGAKAPFSIQQYEAVKWQVLNLKYLLENKGKRGKTKVVNGGFMNLAPLPFSDKVLEIAS